MATKKIKLSDLICEADNNQLQEILINLVTNNPTLEEEIRIALTPKAQINNSVAYYKKMIQKLPAKITTAGTVKLVIETLKPLQKLASEYKNSRNFNEECKVLMAIIEILSPKTEDCRYEKLEKYLTQQMESWGIALENLTNQQHIDEHLNYFFKLKESKFFITEDDEYFISPINDDSKLQKLEKRKKKISYLYYNFITHVLKNVFNESILNCFDEFVSKNIENQDCCLLAKLYVLKNKNEDAQFLKCAKKYSYKQTIMDLLKEYYLENKQYKNILDLMFKHLEEYNDLSYRSGNDYLVAQDFIKMVQKKPYKELIDKELIDEKIHQQIQDVLILLITAGDPCTAYSVAFNASWWLEYVQLKNEYPQEWVKNYEDIVKRLEKKYQSKHLLAIYEFEKDTARAFKYIANSDSQLRIWAARIVITTNPVEALQVYIKYLKYHSIFSVEEKIVMEKELKILKNHVPQDKIKDVNTLLEKII